MRKYHKTGHRAQLWKEDVKGETLASDIEQTLPMHVKTSSAIENDIKALAAASPGQEVVVLADMHEDSVASPSQSPQGHHPMLYYVLVDMPVWSHVPDYGQKIFKILTTYKRGGGKSLAIKCLAVYQKALTAISNFVNVGAQERALCEAIMLTKSMRGRSDWWADPAVLDEAVSTVKALGQLWRNILHARLRPRNVSMLLAWLRAAREEWENEAEQRLLEPVTFHFPLDERNPDAVDILQTPFHEPFPHGQLPSPEIMEARKRSHQESSPLEDSSSPQGGPKKVRRLYACHPKCAADQPRHSALQLRCESGTTKRVLVVQGAAFLRMVAIALAEAFGVPGVDFDYRQNCGRCPEGTRIKMDSRRVSMKTRILEVLREPGQQLHFSMTGCDILASLDAVQLWDSHRNKPMSQRPMPRCVGSDASMTPIQLERLNRAFLKDRGPMKFVDCQHEDAVFFTLEEMARPIAYQCGYLVIENILGWHELLPLVI